MLSFSNYPQSYQQELDMLHNLLAASEGILRKSPPGNLRVHKKGTKVYYSVRDAKTVQGLQAERYLKRGDPMLPLYIRKYCAAHTIPRLKTAISHLVYRPARYSPDTLLELFAHFVELFSELTPHDYCTREHLLKCWQSESFPRNPFHPEKLLYRTDRGEYVRSKNECLCANILYAKGIPYKCEKGLLLKNGEVLYPDFTILSPVSGKTFYLEVCGLMSKENYQGSFLQRVDKYAANGVYVGDNLLLVFESTDSPFNSRAFSEMLDRTVLAVC